MTDWLKIKIEYIHGSIGYRALAKKHGVAFSTLSKRAAAEDWAGQKKKNKDELETKVKQMSQEKAAEDLSDVVAIKSRVKLKLMQMIESAIPTIEDGDTDRLRKVVQSYKDMCEIDKAMPIEDAKEGGGVALIPAVIGEEAPADEK